MLKGDPGVDILSVVSQHEAHVEFPKEVYEQIESIENDIDQEEAKTRTDLRNETIVTIDGDDAKDLDDAISLRRLITSLKFLTKFIFLCLKSDSKEEFSHSIHLI